MIKLITLISILLLSISTQTAEKAAIEQTLNKSENPEVKTLQKIPAKTETTVP